MDKVLFNLHDIVLIVIVVEGLILAALTIVSKRNLCNLLLGTLLLLCSAVAFDVLIYWCIPLKDLFAQAAPYLFFLFGFAYFLLGPILLWYTRALLYQDFRLQATDLLHLIPMAIYLLFYYQFFYPLEEPEKQRVLYDFAWMNQNLHYAGYIWLQKLHPLIYGIISFQQLLAYRKQIENTHSNKTLIDFSWLKLLLWLFLFAWLWTLVTQVFAQFVSQPVSASMGIISNYFMLMLVNALVVYSLSHSGVFSGIRMASNIPNATGTDSIDIAETLPPTYGELLRSTMQEKKLYLIVDITLEQLAEKLAISPKALSATINSDFGQNFFEFINAYRVAHAQQLLLNDPEGAMDMHSVMLNSGFNSKSAFHRFFKKFTRLTPGQFRKQQLSQMQPEEVTG
jgi:AraC-like DNA-binding protein